MILLTHLETVLCSKLKDLLPNNKGISAIEFAIIGPVFFALVLSLMEFSLLFVHRTMLKHSVQETAALVRIGQTQCYGPAQFRTEICENHVLATGDTCNKMTVRQLSEASFDNANTGGTIIEPVVKGEAVLLQVDYVYDWYIPYVGRLLGQDSNDTFTLTHSELFRNEYFEEDTTCS